MMFSRKQSGYRTSPVSKHVWHVVVKGFLLIMAGFWLSETMRMRWLLSENRVKLCLVHITRVSMCGWVWTLLICHFYIICGSKLKFVKLQKKVILQKNRLKKGYRKYSNTVITKLFVHCLYKTIARFAFVDQFEQHTIECPLWAAGCTAASRLKLWKQPDPWSEPEFICNKQNHKNYFFLFYFYFLNFY